MSSSTGTEVTRPIVAYACRRSRPAVFSIALACVPVACTKGRSPPPAQGDTFATPAAWESLAERGRPLAAARALERTIATLQGDSRCKAYARLALLRLELGLLDGASETARAAQESGCDAAEIRYVLGETARRRERMAEAERQLEAAFRAMPNEPRVLLALGRLRLRALGACEALDLLRQAAERARGGLKTEARTEYARALTGCGRAAEAVNVLLDALSEDPFSADALAELARAYYRLKDRKRGRFAEELHKRFAGHALEREAVHRLYLQGKEAKALAQQGAVFEKEKKFLEAIRAYEAALEADPAEPLARRRLAELLVRLGRFEEAERAARGRTGSQGTESFEAGTFDKARARTESALGPAGAALLEAIGSKPLEECSREYRALGRLLLERGDPRGFDCLFLAAELDPQDAESLELLLRGLQAEPFVFVRLSVLVRLSRLKPEDTGIATQLARLRAELGAGGARRNGGG